jgi:GTP-binding protein
LGTVVWRVEGEAEEIADLCEAGERVLIARGGVGGRGNARFATSERRAPHVAERGLPGERMKIRLEMRLVADVGLVGLPNAGKSSLLRAMTRATPKVAEYPFTTVEPFLGAVEQGYERALVVDTPALVDGADEGNGLGAAFLQHVRRARVLVMVADAAEGAPLEDVRVLRREVEAFGHGLHEKAWVVALNKLDLPGARRAAERAAEGLASAGVLACGVSAGTGEGVDTLVGAVLDRVRSEQEVAGGGVQHTSDARAQPELTSEIEIVRTRRGFLVRGAKAVDVVVKLGLESEEARAEVARRLRRAGVVSALRRAGVKVGDRVRIGPKELKWPL